MASMNNCFVQTGHNYFSCNSENRDFGKEKNNAKIIFIESKDIFYQNHSLENISSGAK